MRNIFLIFALLVSACGWSPMYSTGGSVQQLEYSVHVSPITGTDGIDLRNKLRAQLNPFGEPTKPLYRLDVKMHPQANILKGVQRTGDATWQEIRISASYDLVDTRTNKKILSGTESVSESYTFVQNLIAADSAAANATRSAVRMLSEKISSRAKVFIQANPESAE